MLSTENDARTACSIGIVGFLVCAALLLQRSHLALAVAGAVLVVSGLVFAGARYVSNRRSSRGFNDGMIAPGALVFAGAAATILCDVDLAVQALNIDRTMHASK